ncbi:hypothetical protein PHISCL_04397 [Aspergillus sclerotialis]|uniref:Ubiquitin-like domain-containing protein n=1 Tax=Aspergillus sclerotialis TaxID=2070753 RepID=A0A3A2ZJG7_9EURO|nr:hypothetical protein PHISCL_04397 [Aspergillus sclerotialis]
MKLANRFNITIDPSPHASDHSSLSDEEDYSGGQVSGPSDLGSHEYHDPYDEWAHLPYPDEIKPSDSASRPRTSHNSRNPIHGSRSGSGRRLSRRHAVQERESLSRRRRPPSPESPESVDSAEEYPTSYNRLPHGRGFWPHISSAYAHSSSSGPSYVYPHGAVPNGAFLPPNSSHPSDQLIRLGHHSQAGQGASYNPSVYAYGPQFQNSHGHHPHTQQISSHARGDLHSPTQQSMPHVPPPHPSTFGGRPLGSHELVPYGPGSYYHFRESYPMVPPGMIPPYFSSYPRVPSPTQMESSPSPVPTAADTAKDEAIARLEKLILQERTEREAKEAREAQEAAEKVAREERAAHEKKIALEAAALARAEAEQKAAEEAAKAKEEAEKVAAAAAAEAAAAATEAANAAAASKIPPEKKKPIKFKDAVGRKFSFPFDLCCTWQGMEELIRQAFLHIEVIGPHVAEGHYDLVGPNGDIILPQVWETVVEPDWTITMHMWPIPEKPKTPEPQVPEATDGPAPSAEEAVADASEMPRKPGPKKPRTKAPDPGAFAMWMMGSNRSKLSKTLKTEKKPEVIQHGSSCRVM